GCARGRGARGDGARLRCADPPGGPATVEPTGLLGMFQFTKDDVMYVIELGVMMLLGLVVLFMVIRPLVKRILAAEVVPALTGAAPVLADGGANSEGGGAPGQALLPPGGTAAS